MWLLGLRYAVTIKAAQRLISGSVGEVEDSSAELVWASWEVKRSRSTLALILKMFNV